MTPGKPVGKLNVKPGKLAEPPSVVTITPPEAPFPTTAVIVVLLTTVKEVAAIPPKLTVFAPVKFVPVIVTVVPAMALVGLNEVIVGAGMKVNMVEYAVPPGVVTKIFPVEPLPTTAVNDVDDATENDVAGVFPN